MRLASVARLWGIRDWICSFVRRSVSDTLIVRSNGNSPLLTCCNRSSEARAAKSRPRGEKPADMTGGQGRWTDTGSVCTPFRWKNLLSQSKAGPPETATIEDLQFTLQCLVVSKFFMCQHAGKRMLARGRGSIINIGSLASVSALGRGHAFYSMGMGAVVQMTRELSTEWASGGVRVNAILPGATDTKRAVMEMFPNSGLFELYGSSEAGWVTMLHPDEQFTHLGTVGRECVGSAPIRILDDNGADVPLVAKIERPQALARLDSILVCSDMVMVARGDLGLEMPLERVPRAQKQITARARAMKVPVILATQVLESMTVDARPTRAEVSDAANAVSDGVDVPSNCNIAKDDLARRLDRQQQVVDRRC